MKKYLCLLCVFLLLFASMAGCGEDDSGANQNVRTTTCSLCRGDGVCNHCSGEAFRDGRRCNSCDGSGDCRVCLGAGRLEVYEIDGQDCVNCGSCHGEATCQSCDGTGRRPWGKCMTCDGDGECRSCQGRGYRFLGGF